MSATLLLPLDGSDTAETAAAAALDRAEREGAVVHALYVVDTRRYGDPALSSAEVLLADEEDDGRRTLAAFGARATARGVETETHRCRGDPRERLVEYARAVGADEVVAARRIPHAVRNRLAAAGVTVTRPDQARA